MSLSHQEEVQYFLKYQETKDMTVLNPVFKAIEPHISSLFNRKENMIWGYDVEDLKQDFWLACIKNIDKFLETNCCIRYFSYISKKFLKMFLKERLGYLTADKRNPNNFINMSAIDKSKHEDIEDSDEEFLASDTELSNINVELSLTLSKLDPLWATLSTYEKSTFYMHNLFGYDCRSIDREFNTTKNKSFHTNIDVFKKIRKYLSIED